MKDIPILFKGMMVRAIQENRKTQTRRVIKPPPEIVDKEPKYEKHTWALWSDNVPKYRNGLIVKSPYGSPGDKLWVRETFRVDGFEGGYDNGIQEDGDHDFWCGGATVTYKSDDFKKPVCVDGENWEPEEFQFKESNIGKLRPSIFMPRWASRIKLNVTRSRVERLQDISEEDAEAEGCNKEWYHNEAGSGDLWPCPYCDGFQVHPALGENLGVTEVDCTDCNTSRKMFMHLWDSINARPKPAKRNPNTGNKEECYISYPWEDIKEERTINKRTWYVRGNPLLWVTEFLKAEGKKD